MWTALICGGILLIIILYFISSYNGFVSLKNKVDEAFATMDVYLKKRYDLIPNLVEVVKGYASHEKETLQKVIEARNMAMQAGSIDEKRQGEANLANSLKSVFALAESYPNLKANENFIDLQGQLQKMEEDIAQARKYYNAIVKAFNTKTESFPAVIIARMFNFQKRDYFEIEDGAQRENVKVKF